MSGLAESVTAILGASERRLETISNNVANISTAGYKRRAGNFSIIAQDNFSGVLNMPAQGWSDLSQGKMNSTGNPLDLAVAGQGFFQLRAGEEIVYSRQGQFRRAAEGTVVTPQGHALQQAGGGDLVLDQTAVEILADGTVLDEGRPVARIALFAPAGDLAPEPLAGSYFRIAPDAAEEVAAPQMRQGMIEASNVAIADEMVAMMAAVRDAERGSRLAQTYDELLGRAISTFGQGGR